MAADGKNYPCFSILKFFCTYTRAKHTAVVTPGSELAGFGLTVTISQVQYTTNNEHRCNSTYQAPLSSSRLLIPLTTNAPMNPNPPNETNETVRRPPPLPPPPPRHPPRPPPGLPPPPAPAPTHAHAPGAGPEPCGALRPVPPAAAGAVVGGGGEGGDACRRGGAPGERGEGESMEGGWCMCTPCDVSSEGGG